MNPNNQGVPFGAKQKFILTPNEGYEIDSVTVVNTTTGNEFLADLEKVSKNPPQWACSFKQPAGVVRLKTKTKPILYSVIIEDCENCNIVLVDEDEAVQVEMQVAENAASQDHEDDGEQSKTDEPDVSHSDEQTEEESVPNFKKPQHSFKNLFNTKKVSSVEESEESDKNSNKSEPTDRTYDPGEFADELEEFEPTYITQAEHDKKCKLAWEYRERYSAGKISKEEFEKVRLKHTKFLDDVSAGKIVVKN